MTNVASPDLPDTLAELNAGTLRELAPDGIFVADDSGRYIYVNAAGARMLGRDKDEILDLSMTDLIRAEERPRLLREREAMLHGETLCTEWQLQRKDGSWIDVEITGSIQPGGLWQGFVRDISRRKSQEAERDALLWELQGKSAWLDAVLQRLPVGVVLFKDTEHIVFNQVAQDLLGPPLSADGGLRQYAQRILYPDGRAVPEEEFPSMRALCDGESVAATEFLIRREDGTERNVLTSAGPIRDGSGRILGAVGVFQDVTERILLERAMRENERLLDAVFELMPTGVRIADAKGKVIRTNHAARELWRGAADGPTEGVMRAWYIKDGTPLEYQDWPARRAARGELVSNELVRMQCFDGSFRTVIKQAAPLRDEAGRITGAVVVDEDVTALFEAKEKLQVGERLFRTVFELLPVGVYIADQNGKVVLGNPEGQRIWEGLRYVGPDQFHEYKAWWLDTGKRITADEWGVARAVRRGETSRCELIRIEAFDGSKKVVMNWAAPLHAEDGSITGAVALNQDVTALYQTQEQLRNAVLDREHILAVVAHDLRHPLNALALKAAVCERKLQTMPVSEDLRRAAASIQEMAYGMAGLVEDLLAISVAGTGRSMLKLTPVEPEAVLRKAVELAAPAYAAAGLELTVRADAGLPVVQADMDRLQRVFANLLDNALKFTPRPGRVVLSAEAQAGAVLFGVANSGEPVPPAQLERMFQPFWQGSRDDRRGSGLGMSICRSLIEAHGGSIWAEPAAGMRVHVRFLLPTAISAQGHIEIEP